MHRAKQTHYVTSTHLSRVVRTPANVDLVLYDKLLTNPSACRFIAPEAGVDVAFAFHSGIMIWGQLYCHMLSRLHMRVPAGTGKFTILRVL